jgi:hypothetical protein
LLMSAAHCLAWVSAACRGSHKSTGIIWEGEGRHDVVRRGSLWRLEVAGTAGFNGDRVRRGLDLQASVCDDGWDGGILWQRCMEVRGRAWQRGGSKKKDWWSATKWCLFI